MSRRTEKIASVIKQEIVVPISNLASENSAGLATVTNVIVMSDLRNAKVYISIYSKSMTVLEFVQILENNVGKIKAYISPRLKLKYIPSIKFFADDTLDQMEHIQNLLDKSKQNDSSL